MAYAVCFNISEIFIATEQSVEALRFKLTSEGVSHSNFSRVIVDTEMVFRVFFVLRPINAEIFIVAPCILKFI